ncbi:hypothetical protein E1200_13030 [Actinomadura sp. GC306]|uniref:choice-of-anchor P family protein n=1 Tax=Actinomadura sp. GC306 TaxID=2530367 RepID=UPI001042F9A4|nr:choice-of-anchor P family protein [Actinomadura sp. GC306]TDC68008.1 hypothetical protein E1200_13030 [Actinomadura sp. GC306]
MRYSHAVRGFVATGLLTTGLAAGLLSAPGTALAAQPQGEGSAYGLTASGPVSVPPVPAVSSTTETVRKSLLSERSTDLVKASALDVSASPDRAKSSVADAVVPAAKLRADAVTAKCQGGEGAAHLADAVIAGKRLDASPAPNTTIPVNVEGLGRAALTLNKQERMADGRLAVTAMELELPLPGKAANVRIASATCGQQPGGPGGPGEQPSDAPAPTPVEHDLPVTG